MLAILGLNSYTFLKNETIAITFLNSSHLQPTPYKFFRFVWSIELKSAVDWQSLSKKSIFKLILRYFWHRIDWSMSVAGGVNASGFEKGTSVLWSWINGYYEVNQA